MSHSRALNSPASCASPSPSRCPPSRASPSLFSVDDASSPLRHLSPPPASLFSSHCLPSLFPLSSLLFATTIIIFYVDDLSPLSLPPGRATSALSLPLSSLLFVNHHSLSPASPTTCHLRFGGSFSLKLAAIHPSLPPFFPAALLSAAIVHLFLPSSCQPSSFVLPLSVCSSLLLGS